MENTKATEKKTITLRENVVNEIKKRGEKDYDLGV